ncbi:MAG: tetratricopeptide repeat protein, partial [Deltaproteobacteria bacterium]|nr:tetratricopeptide repeat protein [Deltaproteobacteria bacterium]
ALENIEKAIARGDKLELEHPGLKSEAYNLKGSILIGMDSYEEALSSFEEALKDELYTTPEYPLHNMSFIYLQDKLYDKAQESATRALDHNPHYAPAWEMLGKIFLQQGKDAQAIEAFKHAILEFPGYIDAHWEIAQLYIRLGDTEQGIFHLNEVIRLDAGGVFGNLAEQQLKELGKTPKNK